MREFYLSSVAQLAHLESCNVMPKEMVILEAAPSLPASDYLLGMQILSRHTSSAFGKISVEQVQSAFAQDLLKNAAGLVIKEVLAPRKDFFIDPALVRDHPYEHRSLAASRWQKIVKSLDIGGEKQLIPEVVLQESSLDLLFPTLGAYAKFGVPMVLLDPGVLSLKEASRIRDQLILLQMTGVTNIRIHFSVSHPWHQFWEARSENLYAGPLRMDIDVANTCTHNCVFCGMWAESMVNAQKRRSGGVFSAEMKAEYSARIEREHCLKILESLPATLEMVQFGGKGDPFTHPDMMDFVEACRTRNVRVSVLSNFAYMNKAILDRLHALSPGLGCQSGIEFIINLSAATAETYQSIRPNQKTQVFERILGDIKYLTERRQQTGFGVDLIIMSVTNKLNYRESADLVALADRVGVSTVWIKPIEVHGEGTLELLLDEDEHLSYAEQMNAVLFLADLLDIFVINREVSEVLISKHFSPEERKKSFANFLRKSSGRAEFVELCRRRNISWMMLSESGYFAETKTKNTRQRGLMTPISLPKPPPVLDEREVLPEVIPVIRKSLADWGVMNADLASDFLDLLPCKIGYQYLRIEVSGRVLPCCIANYPVARLAGQNLQALWFSDALGTFRRKMAQAPQEGFHRKDLEWKFCQQCCHLDMNKNFSRRQGFVVETQS